MCAGAFLNGLDNVRPASPLLDIDGRALFYPLVVHLATRGVEDADLGASWEGNVYLRLSGVWIDLQAVQELFV